LYYGVRIGLDASSSAWNNLTGIFPPVLKLFQYWNIIPSLSVKYGIMVFQLFYGASTKVFYGWNNIPKVFQRQAIHMEQPSTPTLKKRRKSILRSYMPARKNTSRKIRLMKRTRQNRPVPAWVVIRTNRKVRTNPKRRLWRRSDVKVG
jgi:large subunit ribosomal protein L39e